MTIEPCQILERPPHVFWFRATATLASPLTPAQVSERIRNALPRMVVPPDAGTVLRIKRVYGGRVQGDSFSLSGPYTKNGPTLSVQGTIEPHMRGSRIHLTAYPAGSIMALVIAGLCGILIPVLWWILDGAFSFGPLFLLPVCGVLGAMSYALRLIGVGSQLGYLLNFLQTLFCKKV